MRDLSSELLAIADRADRHPLSARAFRAELAEPPDLPTVVTHLMALVESEDLEKVEGAGPNTMFARPRQDGGLGKNVESKSPLSSTTGISGQEHSTTSRIMDCLRASNAQPMTIDDLHQAINDPSVSRKQIAGLVQPLAWQKRILRIGRGKSARFTLPKSSQVADLAKRRRAPAAAPILLVEQLVAAAAAADAALRTAGQQSADPSVRRLADASCRLHAELKAIHDMSAPTAAAAAAVVSAA